ncbi:MAG: hypothetical protein MJZ73_06500 [Bacteroidaceae bacterium]|nr:hypothetical protein [Bacteroidaceae bacterium]
MKGNNQKYLYIEPYSYIKIIGKTVFLFNTLDNSYIYKENQRLSEIVSEIIGEDSAGMAVLSKMDLLSLREIISEIRDTFIGDIIKINHGQNKPFFFQPQFNTCSYDTIRNHLELNANKNMLENLFSIHIILSGNLTQNESEYILGHDRITNNWHTSDKLQPNDLVELIDELKAFSLSRITFIGLDEWKKSFSDQLFQKIISKLPNYLKIDYVSDISKFQNLNSSGLNHIYVLSQKDLTKIRLNNLFDNCFVYLFKTANELERLYNHVKVHNFGSLKIKPVASSNNIEEIKGIISVSKERIVKKADIENIIQNKVINTKYFGKLWVFPDGKVSSTPSSHRKYDTVISALKQIIVDRTSVWNRIRAFHEPCALCVFQDLCPPLTQFELTGEIKCICGIM